MTMSKEAALELSRTNTPQELAAEALKDAWFEWDKDRRLAEEAVAAVIQRDRDRTRAVVNRIRVLLPGLLRDLDVSLGGRLT